jgi:prepilin-type N-terminal cleavage/methylation domain-containing protein
VKQYPHARTRILAVAPRNNRGFTLAELTVVLVVIGLLIGLILLGRGVINQSRIKSFVNDFEGLKVAVLAYTDRYGALPGDDGRAAGRWTASAKNGTSDGRISGSYQDPPPAGDPMVALTVDAAQGESLNFWWHLRLAGLIVAPPPVITPVAQPLNPYAGVTGVEWGPIGLPRLAICTANLPGDIAIGVENQLDEGSPRTGLIRVAKQAIANEPTATADATIVTLTAADADMYLLCYRLD